MSAMGFATAVGVHGRRLREQQALACSNGCGAGVRYACPSRRPSSSGWSSGRRSVVRASDMGLEFPSKTYSEGLRVGVVSARWNGELVDGMKASVLKALAESGVSQEDIVETSVAGCFELPMAARLISFSQKLDAVICLGILIKGESTHYDLVASSVAHGLMDLQLSSNVPMVFGVLCCQDEAQARDRSVGHKSHAEDWAKTALEMGKLKKTQLGGVSAGKKSVGF